MADELTNAELSAAVAEKMMGWTGVHFDGPIDRIAKCWYGNPLGEHWQTTIPQYATDIGAAFEVLEKTDGMWKLIRVTDSPVEGNPEGKWYSCHVRIGNNTGDAHLEPSPARAICLAALAAVESESEVKDEHILKP